MGEWGKDLLGFIFAPIHPTPAPLFLKCGLSMGLKLCTGLVAVFLPLPTIHWPEEACQEDTYPES